MQSDALLRQWASLAEVNCSVQLRGGQHAGSVACQWGKRPHAVLLPALQQVLAAAAAVWTHAGKAVCTNVLIKNAADCKIFEIQTRHVNQVRHLSNGMDKITVSHQ